ncbi:hypothetical protein [Caldimonas brevitalea]|uniref:hypothetical protein n=1 Tax=Caldimonas brevitalea TaxID=413882 RepID=UPI0012F8BFA1|nr:hypothetical protein [Caldimonas brevitalea]
MAATLVALVGLAGCSSVQVVRIGHAAPLTGQLQFKRRFVERFNTGHGDVLAPCRSIPLLQVASVGHGARAAAASVSTSSLATSALSVENPGSIAGASDISFIHRRGEHRLSEQRGQGGLSCS